MKLQIGKKKKASVKKSSSPKQREMDFTSPLADSPPTSAEDWAITGKEINEQFALQRMSQDGRAPELYIKDGEEKRIQFREDEPIAAIFQYAAKFNGRWQRFTKPRNGEVDRFLEAGLKPALRAVYEVVDIDGYVDKQGKKHRYIPRFFVVSGRLAKQLRQIKKKFGSLTEFPIEISRQGAATDTTYMLIPERPKALPKEIQKLPRLSKEFRRYYAPPDAKKQGLIIGTLDEETESPY